MQSLSELEESIRHRSPEPADRRVPPSEAGNAAETARRTKAGVTDVVRPADRRQRGQRSLRQILADRYRRRVRNVNDRHDAQLSKEIARAIDAGSPVTVPFEHLKGALWEHGSVNAKELTTMHNTATHWAVDESGAYAPADQATFRGAGTQRESHRSRS
jgi:hypothetical protein